MFKDFEGKDFDCNQSVVFEDRDGNKVVGLFTHVTKHGDCYVKDIKTGKPYWRKPEKVISVNLEEIDLEEISFSSKKTATQKSFIKQDEDSNADLLNSLFSINQRFTFLEQLVRMVIRNNMVSLIVSGEGGIGKTYTVIKELEAAGLVKPDHYFVIKGYSTAKGLYNTLFEHNDKLIIFDDCDEVLLNDVSRNILKGALDSYDQRIISWVKNFSEGDDTPQEFEFTGRIIFISNLNRKKIHQAIISRAACIDLTLTIEEKIDRMSNIISHLRPNVPLDIKMEALDIIIEFKDQVRDLNFRTLSKAIDTYYGSISDGNTKVDSKELTSFMILS